GAGRDPDSNVWTPGECLVRVVLIPQLAKVRCGAGILAAKTFWYSPGAPLRGPAPCSVPKRIFAAPPRHGERSARSNRLNIACVDLWPLRPFAAIPLTQELFSQP